MTALSGSQHGGELLLQAAHLRLGTMGRIGFCLLGVGIFFAATAVSQDTTPPNLVFTPISISLDSTGRHTLSPSEIGRIAAGSSDSSGITNMSVAPDQFGFCDIGTQTITLALTDGYGNVTNRAGPIEVRAASAAPRIVFVDGSYSSACG